MLATSITTITAALLFQLEIIGMTVKLLPHTKATTEQEIAKMEKMIGAKLADDYRTFLLKYNGAIPKTDENPHNYVGFPIEWNGQPWAKRYGNNMLHGLYSLDKDAPLPWWGLAYEAYIEPGRIPKDTIPIGLDAGGDQILIGISGPNRGKIFFWARDEAPVEDDAPVTYENVGFVANSFSEFVNSLYAWKR